MGNKKSVSAGDISFDHQDRSIPFPVRRIESASILWLNERWFIEKGINILATETLADVEANLLKEFAVESITDLNLDDGGTVQEVSHYLWADMYGGSGGTHHGGSGRAGSINGYNAKGIGRTPLAADNVDFHHSHGYMWLHEAIREIIASEVAAAELPYGAIPIIALIDTGIDFDDVDASEYRRRVIVVRPDFFRPAHFERSIFFGSSGTEDSYQYHDAIRVRNMVKQAVQPDGVFPNGQASLVEMFAKFGQQIGAARALRLWQGQFLSSNLSIDGALVDFGAFCAMPDWRCAERALGECFGNEDHQIHSAIKSVFFNFWKYDRSGCHLADQAISTIQSNISSSFKSYIYQGLGLNLVDNEKYNQELYLKTLKYYNKSQMQNVIYEDQASLNNPWIYKYFSLACKNDSSDEAELCKQYLTYIDNNFPNYLFKSAMRFKVENFFKPREDIYPDRLDSFSKKYVGSDTRKFTHSRQKIERLICSKINASRRIFPLFPDEFVIVYHLIEGAFSIFLALIRSEMKWIVSGPLIENCTIIGDAIFEDKLFNDKKLKLGSGKFAYLMFDYSDLSSINGNILILNKKINNEIKFDFNIKTLTAP
jgi:hypothetical protein